jgi:hypothetical protein
MSLKTFHIFFISVAVLLCLGFGVWCFRQTGYTGLGVGSFVLAVALVVYEIIFLRKLKTR